MVFCNSIREAKFLKEFLYTFDLKELKNKYKKIDNNYIDYIYIDNVFTEYDDKDFHKNKIKKIFFSTNYNVRYIDIRTSDNEELNGGLHIILTYMPSNFRI